MLVSFRCTWRDVDITAATSSLVFGRRSGCRVGKIFCAAPQEHSLFISSFIVVRKFGKRQPEQAAPTFSSREHLGSTPSMSLTSASSAQPWGAGSLANTGIQPLRNRALKFSGAFASARCARVSFDLFDCRTRRGTAEALVLSGFALQASRTSQASRRCTIG
jgi:hypothetical protein